MHQPHYSSRTRPALEQLPATMTITIDTHLVLIGTVTMRKKIVDTMPPALEVVDDDDDDLRRQVLKIPQFIETKAIDSDNDVASRTTVSTATLLSMIHP